MEYIIVGLLVVIIILLIVLLTRKNNSELNEKLSRTEINVIKEISEFKHNFSNDLNKDFNSLNDRIEYKLNLINQKVNEAYKDLTSLGQVDIENGNIKESIILGDNSMDYIILINP